jgi:predicted phage replisome organizer
MSESHKYFWLKLKRDFFKRHDIVIIEAMPNGKDYILFYLKLLCESVDHSGGLRFSETIPYSEDMLATITRTNVDIVRSAVKIFSELGMMERFDDGTLFMSQVENMIGSETGDAVRMRIARDNKKQLLTTKDKGEQCSEPFKNRSPELDIESEKEKEKEREEPKSFCSSPESEEVSRENERPPLPPIATSSSPPGEAARRIDRARAAWNEAKAGPECRLLAITFPPQDREDCLRMMTVYSDADISDAVSNYAKIRDSPEHEIASPYRSFVGFIRGGVEKFISSADPWSAYKKRAGNSFRDQEEREREKALDYIKELAHDS